MNDFFLDVVNHLGATYPEFRFLAKPSYSCIIWVKDQVKVEIRVDQGSIFVGAVEGPDGCPLLPSTTTTSVGKVAEEVHRRITLLQEYIRDTPTLVWVGVRMGCSFGKTYYAFADQDSTCKSRLMLPGSGSRAGFRFPNGSVHRLPLGYTESTFDSYDHTDKIHILRAHVVYKVHGVDATIPLEKLKVLKHEWFLETP